MTTYEKSMRSLIVIAATMACSGAWAEDSSIELLCTFQDGTDSISTYPLASYEDWEYEGLDGGSCSEDAVVSLDEIITDSHCHKIYDCTNRTGDSTWIANSWRRAEITRKTGVINITYILTTKQCDPVRFPDKQSPGSIAGSCVKASEVENKF